MEELFNVESGFDGYHDFRGKKKPKFFKKLDKGLAKFDKKIGISKKLQKVDKGLAKFDKKIGLSKKATAVKKSVEKVLNRIVQKALGKMTKKYDGPKGLNNAIKLFNESPQGKKVKKMASQVGTSFIRNKIRDLVIPVVGVNVPVGPAITLWANTKDGRATLGRIPNNLGGYDLRKTFIFEGLDPDKAIAMASVMLGVSMVPGGKLVKTGLRTGGKLALGKATGWKDTRDK
jgi:hypothetical protein